MAEENKTAIEVEKELIKDFGNKLKDELAEIGLIKQEERLKITKNTKGFNYEFTLLGDPEKNLDREERLRRKLDERFGA